MLVTVYAALLAASVSVGYWAGTRASRRTKPLPSANPTVPSRPSKNSIEEKTDGNESDESDDSGAADEDISALRVDSSDTCKMVRHFLPSKKQFTCYSL